MAWRRVAPAIAVTVTLARALSIATAGVALSGCSDPEPAASTGAPATGADEAATAGRGADPAVNPVPVGKAPGTAQVATGSVSVDDPPPAAAAPSDAAAAPSDVADASPPPVLEDTAPPPAEDQDEEPLPPEDVEAAEVLEAYYDGMRARPPLDPDTALTALEDPDPDMRAYGAWNLLPEGAALEPLLDLVANDPDPRVRIAALASLEEGEGFATLRAIVEALDDPDPEVVLAAIDSIEFAGDETNTRDLERLHDHPDPRVARAARRAMKFLTE